VGSRLREATGQPTGAFQARQCACILIVALQIDRSTHLLFPTDEQQAEDRVVTTYSDYHTVDGLTLPFTVRIGNGVDQDVA